MPVMAWKIGEQKSHDCSFSVKPSIPEFGRRRSKGITIRKAPAAQSTVCRAQSRLCSPCKLYSSCHWEDTAVEVTVYAENCGQVILVPGRCISEFCCAIAEGALRLRLLERLYFTVKRYADIMV